MTKLFEVGLSEFALDICRTELDASTAHLLKRNILDSYAGICGSMYDTEMLAKFDRMVDIAPSECDVPVWGTGKAGTHADAIFLNSILGRRSDLLNTYFSPNKMGVAHPSDNVSLILTLADWLGKSGQDVLRLTHLAYQLAGMFSNYYFPESIEYDHDAAAIFYTTIIIGCALDLNVDELTNAQRIAGGMGLDTNQSARDRVTDWKHCTYASCALRGLFAVKMAKAGIEGPYEIYQGTAGVNRFFPHSEKMFEVKPDLESVVFKRWPALVFCQTPIDVALDLVARIGDPKSIQRIDVSTYDMCVSIAAGETAWAPDSRAGRTHSLPYCVAGVFAKGSIAYKDFDEPCADDPVLNDLMTKVHVSEDPFMTAAFPAKSACKIMVTRKDGTSETTSRDYPRGDPADPMSDTEIEEKLHTYFFFANKDEASTVIKQISGLEQLVNANELVSPLKRRRI
ncbi:MmgE/PrpD family protein [Ruegeria sp. 2205SS24-7]|uniref:MmgE/PrpD family protein n=1 Tax=Ruegeria discodermiae TaxID=3064389 RepID=UPI002741A767|nr:MmgE/PrpD family protein [Ruegeria sp. 2205SS24-7]MDP5220079.1 MmgE/PrpD family protein [Ruegeria sp. 2205SS24-7]